MQQAGKRQAEGEHESSGFKRQRKQWRVPRKSDGNSTSSPAIQPGDSGIWATCTKGKEGRCVGELRDLFAEYAEQLYESAILGKGDDTTVTNDEDLAAGIESEIKAEIAGIHEAGAHELFTPARVDVQCVVFLKTTPPVRPVAFVKKICEDAMEEPRRKRTRFVKRLSPMELMGRASAEGLEKVAKEVLAPHFHQQPFKCRKFAIRPTIRNHSLLNRDTIIKQVASIVGPGHEVNLKDYELLIVVEVYQNICGVSVVDSSFERLKRFNLAEIFDPTPRDAKEKMPETRETLAPPEAPEMSTATEP